MLQDPSLHSYREGREDFQLWGLGSSEMSEETSHVHSFVKGTDSTSSPVVQWGRAWGVEGQTTNSRGRCD